MESRSVGSDRAWALLGSATQRLGSHRRAYSCEIEAAALLDWHRHCQAAHLCPAAKAVRVHSWAWNFTHSASNQESCYPLKLAFCSHCVSSQTAIRDCWAGRQQCCATPLPDNFWLSRLGDVEWENCVNRMVWPLHLEKSFTFALFLSSTLVHLIWTLTRVEVCRVASTTVLIVSYSKYVLFHHYSVKFRIMTCLAWKNIPHHIAIYFTFHSLLMMTSDYPRAITLGPSFGFMENLIYKI